MNRVGIAAVVSCLAGTAFGEKLYPVEGIAHYRYDIHTGAYWQDGGPRYGPRIAWERDTDWRGFVGADPEDGFSELLDWADVGTPDEPIVVNGFRFSYCTNGLAPVDVSIGFYVNENGFNTADSTTVALFNLQSLPGRDPGSGTNCYQFDVDLPDPIFDQFTLAGNDLDQDGLVDFGYGLFIASCGGCGGEAGPLLADGPLDTSPGSTPDYDLFFPPKWSSGAYVRTDTAVDSLGQFALRLYTASAPGCPLPGCDDGGINVDFDANCIINLSDLTVLLGGYGTTSGATHADGDADGDGDVDLSDLTNLLGRYGNSCE
jgi:hypothetical protein